MKFIKCFIPLLMCFAFPALMFGAPVLPVIGAVGGAVKKNTFVLPISDHLDAPYGHVRVYVLNGSTHESVTYGGPSSFGSVTVNQLGNLITVTLGNGNPDRGLEWTQMADYSGTGFPFVIDFSNTPAAELIHFGGNQFITTDPSGSSDDQGGLAEIGNNNTPTIRFFQDFAGHGWPMGMTGNPNVVFGATFTFTLPIITQNQ